MENLKVIVPQTAIAPRTYFLFQRNTVLSRHHSRNAAMAACRRFLKKHPYHRHYEYSIRTLLEPGYWKPGDVPARHYIVTEEILGEKIPFGEFLHIPVEGK